MKRIKVLVASVLFCAMGYVGYIAHERMNMSEAEKFMQANVEALTSGEAPGVTVTSCLGFFKTDCVTAAGDKGKNPLVKVESN